jgi:hopanoid C-2 methylase
MKNAYRPDRLYERFMHQVRHTFPNRVQPRNRAVAWRDVKRGLTMLGRIIWHVGIAGDYKRVFWGFALPRLLRGDIESVIATALISHHLIVFSREASGGLQNASHYSTRLRETAAVAE